MRLKKWKTVGWVFMALLFLGGLSACSKGKEQAAVGIDEAKLNISSARKAGAERYARKTMDEAGKKLDIAQSNFRKGNYGYAKKQAGEASSLALLAQSEAQAKAAEKKTSKTSPKSDTSKKKRSGTKKK